MALLILDPWVADKLVAERQAAGHDHYDEVWDGVYLITPPKDCEHQELLGRLTAAFLDGARGEPGIDVYSGINVTDREGDWTQNYRVPDVAVYLQDTIAQDRDTHYLGGPDFAVEIESHHDRSHERIPFYAKVGVRELMLVERDPWAIELYRLDGGSLTLVGRILPDDESSLGSTVLGVRFRLIPGVSTGDRGQPVGWRRAMAGINHGA
jgi:Uma2 family endonuclease